ncbi:MAG: tetratricopeptide repeat protein, partial [Elusimicrobiales bacterium]|nr:tetratricopeptide repeat protein [Elusimicrobiales bacterium]
AVKNLKTSLWINPLNEKSYYAYFEIVLKGLTLDNKYLDFIFQDAMLNHPNDAYIYWLNGYYHETIKKNLTLAKKYYSLSLVNDPINQQYYISLARVSTQNDYAFKFSQTYRKVVIENQYDTVLINSDLKNLEDIFGNTIRFKFMKAKYLFDIGKYEEAEGILKNIIDNNPNFLPALKGIAILYEKKKEYSKAVDYYTRYIQYDSGNKEILAKINNLKSMK